VVDAGMVALDALLELDREVSAGVDLILSRAG
jgi:hypothetical protein